MDTKNWINVIVLGLGFFFLFTAFQTAMFFQTLAIAGYLSRNCSENKNQTFGVLDPNFADKVGYYSGAIIYLMVAVGNWVSVSIVAFFGAKWSMVVSGALYVVYIACLIRPLVYTIFIGAFILGAGGGVLWTAQGQVLIQNSSKERMGTTSGIFWFMLESSLVVGSIYLFSYFYLERNSNTHNCFPHHQNNILFSVLTAIAIIGIVILMFIVSTNRKRSGSDGSINTTISEGETEPLMHSRQSGTNSFTSTSKYHPAIQALINAFKMLCTKNMLLLCVTFVYTGYELNYWSGVYGTIIGRTFSNQKYFVGASLFFIGIGEILGGALFGIFGSYTNKFGRDPIILLGFLCHIVCYMISFLFLPWKSINSSIDPSDDIFYGALGPYGVFSNVYVAMAGAFLLGFGDACYNTQIYSLIGVMYPTDDKSAPAMALYKFFQSITAMVGFLTSANIDLQWQLLVLTVLAVAGTMTFNIVEWESFNIEKNRREGLTSTYEENAHSQIFIRKPISNRKSPLDEDNGFMSDSSMTY